MKSNLIIQPYGAMLALGIAGTKEEVTYEANRLYNWGATESEPHFISDTFAYVLTTESKLIQFFANMVSRRMRKERRIVHCWGHALVMGKMALDEVKRETFLKEGEVDKTPYTIGNADFAGLDQ